MNVVTYTKPDTEVPPVGAEEVAVEEARAQAIKEMADLAQELGLLYIARRERETVHDKADRYVKTHNLKYLTKEDRKVWEKFLPTQYLGYAYHHGFENYSHPDGVPMEVRILMRDARKHFAYLEIRTAELKDPDPALFGINARGEAVLLATWGESDLLSFPEIKRMVKYTTRKPRVKITQALLHFLVGVIITGIITIKLTSGMGVGQYLLTCMLGGLLGASIKLHPLYLWTVCRKKYREQVKRLRLAR